MSEVLGLTHEEFDAIVRQIIEPKIDAILAAAKPSELAPQIDWRPAAWFGREWAKEPATAEAMLKKARVKVWKFSQKSKLYSVADANAKIDTNAIASGPRRRRSKIVSLQQAL